MVLKFFIADISSGFAILGNRGSSSAEAKRLCVATLEKLRTTDYLKDSLQVSASIKKYKIIQLK